MLDHVAVAVRDISAVPAVLVGELGATPHQAGPGPGYRFWQWRFAGGGVLEVLEPEGPTDGFLHRFLARRGPGFHHVTFKVPDIQSAMGRAEAAGYEIVNANLESPAWKEAFLHPKQAQGIVVQLAESHPELEPPEWEQSRWPFPEPPGAPGAPTELVALRLSAASEERARRQWEHTLLGSCEPSEGGLRFRWPDSPLHLHVRLNPEAAEGPLGIELAARPGLDLGQGEHPVLGAPFLPVP
ncbi:MAG: VOC family protein [Myxococcota bacterium]|nr:VOC family protein [Myxococcota bacterium]